jgi:hypothetical protein
LFLILNDLSSRVRRLELNTADTSTFSDTNSDVSTLSPVTTPRVLDLEEFVLAINTITNSEDTVIEFSSASVTSDDTTVVELEGILVSFDSDRDRLLSNSSLKSIRVLRGNIGESDVLELVSSRDLASAINTLVRIRGFRDDTVSSDVLESLIHQTTVATLVSEATRAVNELLFREADELAILNEVKTFEGTSGGESPAGTALTLILNISNSTLGGPIDGSRDISDVDWSNGIGSLVLSVVTEVEGGELFTGHSSELVKTELVSDTLLGVVGKDLLVVLSENSESHGVFRATIGKVVGSLPVAVEIVESSGVDLNHLLLSGSVDEVASSDGTNDSKSDNGKSLSLRASRSDRNKGGFHSY